MEILKIHWYSKIRIRSQIVKGRYLVQDIILSRTTFRVRAPRKLILVGLQGLLGPYRVPGLSTRHDWPVRVEGKCERPSDN